MSISLSNGFVFFLCTFTLLGALTSSICADVSPSSGLTAEFKRGDANNDNAIDIADAITVLGYLFPSGGSGTLPLNCQKAADGNDDGLLDIADAISILSSLFGVTTIPLSAPYPECGSDPTPDGLGCDLYDHCASPEIAGLSFVGMNGQGFAEYTLDLDPTVILIRIPGGTFEMGAEGLGPNELPIHTVTLSPYFIAKFETTNAQYKTYCDATGTAYPPDPFFQPGYFSDPAFANHPVVRLTWDELNAPGNYLEWAGLSLPTEAQWEFAARGIDCRVYPWGNELPNEGGVHRANWNTCDCDPPDALDGYSYTAPVDAFAAYPGPFGTVSQAGNANEWCQDLGGPYPVGPVTDPLPASGDGRVARGGNWSWPESHLHGAFRNWTASSSISHGKGFRVALTAP